MRFCVDLNPRFPLNGKNYTLGKDPRTYDLALAILHEEIEHEAWFEELLTGKPSGHFRRSRPGESPYVSKFLKTK
ncbi:hypothetical protein ADU37_CDS19960 [Thermococcus sp. 2319x1]|nr:hypothetical protein ADU37_CDS19960 [Thermococcus sp. 2319x1]